MGWVGEAAEGGRLAGRLAGPLALAGAADGAEGPRGGADNVQVDAWSPCCEPRPPRPETTQRFTRPPRRGRLVKTRPLLSAPDPAWPLTAEARPSASARGQRPPHGSELVRRASPGRARPRVLRTHSQPRERVPSSQPYVGSFKNIYSLFFF